MDKKIEDSKVEYVKPTLSKIMESFYKVMEDKAAIDRSKRLIDIGLSNDKT